MPEFYDDLARGYQKCVQPHLNAIARGIRDDPVSRAFLFEGTDFAKTYAGAEPLWKQQWEKRDWKRKKPMKAPFWANYHGNPCPSCDCRIVGSNSMEIDALFFLQNPEGKTIAVHVEMKRAKETLSFGQAEAYRLRADCYRDERRLRKGVLAHDDFIVILFCGTETDIASAKHHFDHVILHDQARKMFPGYPET